MLRVYLRLIQDILIIHVRNKWHSINRESFRTSIGQVFFPRYWIERVTRGKCISCEMPSSILSSRARWQALKRGRPVNALTPHAVSARRYVLKMYVALLSSVIRNVAETASMGAATPLYRARGAQREPVATECTAIRAKRYEFQCTRRTRRTAGATTDV